VGPHRLQAHRLALHPLASKLHMVLPLQHRSLFLPVARLDLMAIARGIRALTTAMGPVHRSGMECNSSGVRKAHAWCWETRSPTRYVLSLSLPETALCFCTDEKQIVVLISTRSDPTSLHVRVSLSHGRCSSVSINMAFRYVRSMLAAAPTLAVPSSSCAMPMTNVLGLG